MYKSNFNVPSKLKESCVYIMRTYDERIAYVGQTNNFYRRISTFGRPDGFAMEEVKDIYCIKMDIEYIRGLEKVFIGLLQPYGNSERYKYYDVWRNLIIEGEENKIKYILAHEYNCHLSYDKTLLQFIMSCEYQVISRLILDGEEAYSGFYNWHCMSSNRTGWAEPLKNLINLPLVS